MKDEIERTPLLADRVESGFELSILQHVERQEQRRFEFARERFDEALRLVVEIGDGEFCAEPPERLGAPPGDRLVVGDSYDQALLAFEEFRRFANLRDHDLLPAPAFGASWM